MIGAVAVGVVAGLVAGMLGVGGGALFVPALTLFIGLGQVDAEATSLLAIIPVALVGAARQHRYGNVRPREGLAVGLLAIPGAVAGVAIVNVVPERATEIAFACLLLFVAWRLVQRALRPLAGPGSAVEPEAGAIRGGGHQAASRARARP